LTNAANTLQPIISSLVKGGVNPQQISQTISGYYGGLGEDDLADHSQLRSLLEGLSVVSQKNQSSQTTAPLNVGMITGINPDAPYPREAGQPLRLRVNAQPMSQPKVDPKTLSGKIQEWLGAKEPVQQGITEQILSGRGNRNWGDWAQATATTAETGKPVGAQAYADERLARAMEGMTQLEKQQMARQEMDLNERQFQETMRSNRAQEGLESQRISRVGSGGKSLAGTGVERMRDWYIEQGVPPMEAASLAQKSAGMGNTYIPGQGIVPIADSKTLDSLDQSISKIDMVINAPGLSKRTGYTAMIPAKMQGFDAIAAQSRIDQLQGLGFLDAYNVLKGGGQITNIEGEKATQARIRLEQAVTQDDFIEALKEWQAVQIQIRDRMRNQLQGNNIPSGDDIPDTSLIPVVPDLPESDGNDVFEYMTPEERALFD